jgi:hypothetical protein
VSGTILKRDAVRKLIDICATQGDSVAAVWEASC